jgi:DNA-binding NtrC family response regulator
VAPEGLRIEEVASFERAVAILAADPPDAVIANVGPAELPWLELKNFCQNHSPQIPVLFESCVYREARDAGLDELNQSAMFLTKPYSLDELRRAIQLLVLWAKRRPHPPRAQTH